MSKYSDAHLELIETRLTILERRIRMSERLDAHEPVASALPQQVPTEELYLEADRPDVLMFPAHALERDLEGRAFRWIAAGPTIQFLLPRVAVNSYSCHLELYPHAAVNITHLTVSVGASGDQIPFSNGLADGSGLTLTVPPDTIPWISITLHGLTAVRPSALGNGEDDRLLTARFYGIRISPIQMPI